MDAENLAHNGIRSPDPPARSELLFRLRYPGPHRRRIFVFRTPRFCTTYARAAVLLTVIVQVSQRPVSPTRLVLFFIGLTLSCR